MTIEVKQAERLLSKKIKVRNLKKGLSIDLCGSTKIVLSSEDISLLRALLNLRDENNLQGAEWDLETNSLHLDAKKNTDTIKRLSEGL